MSEVKSLWGSISIPDPSADADYVNLMQKQADLLEPQTQGLLLGKVYNGRNFHGVFSSDFIITAPRLNDYSYTLFKTIVGFYRYPVLIYERGQYSGESWSNVGVPFPNAFCFHAPPAASRSLEITPEDTKFVLAPTYTIENFEQFESSLERILQSDTTKVVIKTLLEKSQNVFS
jgi:hypothetical protein